MHATSPTVATQVVFEKRDLDIDDIEAPLPDPFDYVEEHRGTQSSTKQKTCPPESTYIGPSRLALKIFEIFQEVCRMLGSSSPATDPQILFEKWELDVDDCEAPIPDPFDLDEEPINRSHFVTEANGTKGGVLDTERQNQNADDQVNNGREDERSREAIEDQQARKARKRKRQGSETGGLRAGVKEHESERRSKRTRWAIKKKLGIGRKGDIRTVRNLLDLRLGILRDLEKNLAEFTRETTQREGWKQLFSLATECEERYFRTQDVGDLSEAIDHLGAAVKATPQDHPDRAACLSNLGRLLSSRYDRIGAIEDLHQAIEHDTAAVGATPQDHPNRATYLSNLGICISSRYDRIGVIEDLHQAIEHGTAAVGATPQDHPDRAMYLSNLGNHISSRYDRIGAIEDLHQAIEHDTAAVGATPQDHPERAIYLSNLGNRISSRYDRIGVIEDLNRAIEHIKMASASTPQDHPNTARFLEATAGILAYRFILTLPLGNINLEDVRDCISYLKAAWDCIFSEPSFRITLALNISTITHIFRNWESISPSILEKAYSIQELSTILESAILLLPQSSPRSLQRQDHQYNLLKISSLAGDTASYALAAEKPAYHALKLLELSRGIIMGFAIDCRGDLSELKVAYPHLANKFNELRTEIDAPLPESNSLNSTLSPNSEFIGRVAVYNQEKISAMQRREKAIKEMEETIIEIRNLPGHEEFQLPPSSAQLMAMAKDGPIVAFVSSELQSDAIIITSSTIKSIRLSELLYDEIPNWRQEIGNLTKGRSNLRKAAPKNKRMRELLLWLWKVAVRPVLDDLQLITHSATDGTPNSTDDADLPHIWWIGVGPLSMAPFHAAGDYSSNINLNENTMSYAISSYIPTIKSLSYAREKNLTISSDSKSATRLLLVAMPTTPGNANLDVDTEVAQIVGTVLKNESASVEYLEHPCAEAILDNLRLRSYQVIHFSCHGVSDAKDPSSSHLVLVKDGRADKLTVQDIASRNTQGAQIAYLSACSTADNSAIKLADETIHIASGFQLAGFSHVLAAMWPAESGICTEISTEFYRTLFDSNNGCEGHRKVRIAFHKAARKAQKTYWKTPLRWAQYIHIGA